MAYSIDLRECVVKALNDGTPLKRVARIFGISRSTVYDWKRKAAHSESLVPRKSSGRPPKIQDLDSFKEFVEQRPDRTLKEMANDWGNVSQWAVHRAMNKISSSLNKNLKI